MSEPKLISPLLDGFLMGTPMSDHNGVQCCPAMKENSDHKYIVKIISVPASQVQLDALLLTGAYKDPADAMDYFKELAEGIVKEAEFLRDMSRLDGFLSFESWQIVPMEKNALGYQVYLLGSYKRSLEKHMRRTMMTHLQAVNLGMDMCSALATARRAGRMYLDLRPSNIFLSEEKTYRIGDLGFAELDAFRYTSLPGKYISQYTPPELHDPMTTLNMTVDTYSLGMVLYRLYNDGNLPKLPEKPGESYPNPVNADYELAEIIMKAISPKPEDRWQDPADMGEALRDYMQRNSVNDTPITPQSTVISDPEDVVPAAAEAGKDRKDDTGPTAEEAPELESIPMTEEVSAIVAHADDLISHETPEGVVVPEPEELPDPFAQFDPDDEPDAEDDDVPEELPEEEPEPRKARKKLLGKKPEADKSPEDGQKPDKKQKKEKKPKEPKPPKEKKPKKPRKPISKGTIAAIVTVLVLALLGAGGFYYYQEFYLQTVSSIVIEGTQNEMTVTVDTELDESEIQVVCIDTYGNAMTQPLVGGKASFAGLLPNSLYRVQLEVQSFHKLTGKTSDIFTTAAQARIVSFDSITGSEDGSVQLNFTMDGPEPDEWVLVYNAEGEEEVRQTFSGHVVTLKNLSVGKTYWFRLEGPDGLVIDTGDLDLQFTASKLVLAENLRLTTTGTNTLSVRWDPAPVDVISWTVRCYNDEGFEQVLTVTGNEATFQDVDNSKAYTVEVTASGMTQPVRASISANPVDITEFTANEDTPGTLKVSWDYNGAPPETGWLLMYSIDGSETQNVITCEDRFAEITPVIPAAEYSFTIQAANGSSIFNNERSFTTSEAPGFDQYSLIAGRMDARLLGTPEDETWDAGKITWNDYRSEFTAGESVSMVIHGNQNFYLTDEDFSVLYVYRDSEGRVLPKMIISETLNWKEFWETGDYHYAELDLPIVPTRPGDYSLSLYFNGCFAVSTEFTVTEE